MLGADNSRAAATHSGGIAAALAEKGPSVAPGALPKAATVSALLTLSSTGTDRSAQPIEASLEESIEELGVLACILGLREGSPR